MGEQGNSENDCGKDCCQKSLNGEPEYNKRGDVGPLTASDTRPCGLPPHNSEDNGENASCHIAAVNDSGVVA